MKKFKRNFLFLALLAPVLAFADSPNLVVNGSFEQPQINSGSWKQFSSITGWSSDTYGVEVRNNVVGSAEDGSNFVELDTTHNSEIHQDLAGSTLVQGWVNLTFYYSDRPNTSAATNGLVFGFGTDKVVIQGQSNNTSSNVWKSWSGNFYLTTTDVLSFAAGGIDDGVGTSLDNVRVTQLSAAPVPEPTSSGMFGAGLLVAGGLVYRQRQKRT